MTRLCLLTIMLAAGTASAQPATPDAPSEPATPAAPPTPTPAPLPSPGESPQMTTASAALAAEEPTPKLPKAGDFDAGGQLRFPSGPDADGKFATYNWIAVDLKGKYNLLPSITANAIIPVAVHHPDMLMDGTSPSMIGGFKTYLEAKIPKTETGLGLTFGYMHEGAMLLSEKDYPLFEGDYKPGFMGTLITKLKLSSLLSLSLVPAWVYQAGTMQSHAALQLPASLIIKLGDLVQTSADLGVFTGDHYHLSGDAGGRIYAGGSLTVKLGPIAAHAGVGVASLLTGGLYPTIGDSLYVDLNVKYVK